MVTKTQPKTYETATERLYAVADHLEANPEEWSQSIWVHSRSLGGAEVNPSEAAGKGLCGTPGCIAGHGVFVTPVEQLTDQALQYWQDAGAEAFALEEGLAQAIFSAYYHPADLPATLRLLATLDEPRTLRAAIEAGLDLRGADLDDLDLTGVDLSGQNLTDTRFFGTDLTNVDFTGATLGFNDFYDACLDGTKGLPEYILEGAEA